MPSFTFGIIFRATAPPVATRTDVTKALRPPLLVTVVFKFSAKRLPALSTFHSINQPVTESLLGWVAVHPDLLFIQPPSMAKLANPLTDGCGIRFMLYLLFGLPV